MTNVYKREFFDTPVVHASQNGAKMIIIKQNFCRNESEKFEKIRQ
jgi:hypothetical protein